MFFSTAIVYSGTYFTVVLGLALASGGANETIEPSNFNTQFYGFFALGIYILAYFFVIEEEAVHLRKSKPVIVAAGVIWLLVAMAYASIDCRADVSYFLILVGILSSIVDNIPVMFAVLTMVPEMSHEQWLLVTLTAGVGGSLLSVGLAAGVALMGQARGIYTSFAHMKWTWAIALGYAASIYVHIVMSGI